MWIEVSDDHIGKKQYGLEVLKYMNDKKNNCKLHI